MAKGKGKGKGKKPAKRSKARAPSKPKASPKPAALAPTVVQLRFQNEGPPMAKKSKGKRTPTSQLHGAALAARRRSEHKGGGSKGGGHKGGGHKGGRRPRRRNPGTTFVQALGKVLGGVAAAFGAGVVTTVATAKIAPGHPLSLYGIPLGVGLLGAAVATKAPVVGVGIAAGAASPFVLPVSSTVLAGTTTGIPTMNPSPSTVSALRAVAMGAQYRSLRGMPIRGVSNPLGGVQRPLGAVSMGAVYAD